MNALIGSGFCAIDDADFDRKQKFYFNYWLPNIGDRDAVIVDNSEPPILKLAPKYGRIRAIEVQKNLGHVGAHLRQYRPHLLGWSLSWILPALIAYSENRDFIYQESDCLAFGDWEKVILEDMEKKNLEMAFGEGSNFACLEQSLFYIRHDFITEAIWSYLSIPEGDGLCLPENKFEIMEKHNMRIGRFSLPGGRQRPLPMNEKTFYGQKFSLEELDQLKVIGLI